MPVTPASCATATPPSRKYMRRSRGLTEAMAGALLWPRCTACASLLIGWLHEDGECAFQLDI